MATKPLCMKSKFADLAPEVQAELEKISKIAKEQIRISRSLERTGIQDMLGTVEHELKLLTKKQVSVDASLHADLDTLQLMQTAVSDEMHRAEIASRIVDAEKSGPCADLRFNKVYSSLNFFQAKESEFRQRVSDLSSHLAEIEAHINSMFCAQSFSPALVTDTVRAQNSSFLLLAARAAHLHGAIEALQKRLAKLRH